MITVSVAAIKIAFRAMFPDGDLGDNPDKLYKSLTTVWDNHKEIMAYAEAIKSNTVIGDYYDVLGAQLRAVMFERSVQRIRDDSLVQLIGRGTRIQRPYGPHGERC